MRSLLIAILLFCFFHSNAQESKKYLKFKDKLNWEEGYVILKDSVRIDGLIRTYNMNEQKYFNQVSFINKNGDKHQYYPLYLFEYGFGHGKKFISDSNVFYEEVKSGPKVCLYRTQSLSTWSSPGGDGFAPMTYSSENENHYFKKVEEFEFIKIRKRDFWEKFQVYFNDCESVRLKIVNKKYSHKNYDELMDEYNYRCN